MSEAISKRTAHAYVWSIILATPLWALLCTLPVLLYKELHASPLLITLSITLKPATALFATYWSCYFYRAHQFLVRNLLLANVFRFLPFLFFFFVDSPWVILLVFSLYMTLTRGAMPAWMEILRHHLPKESHSKVFALGNAIEYIGTTIVPLFLGFILDWDGRSWRWLFPLTACLGIFSTFFLWRLPALASAITPPPKKDLFLPWKRSLEILRSKPDFRLYMMSFMLGGAGLMIVQPVLPAFFVDTLKLSYTEMILAITVCKGIGYSLTTPFWVKLFNKISILRFGLYVTLIASLFPLLLFSAKWGLIFVFVAYLIYGFMQAGSELSWNMSAVTFSKGTDSLPYSETNILAVGIRGCFIPFLGNLLFLQFDTIGVLAISSLLCLAGSLLLATRKSRYEATVS